MFFATCLHDAYVYIDIYARISLSLSIYIYILRAQSKGTQFWWERGMDAFFASRKHLEAAWAS